MAHPFGPTRVGVVPRVPVVVDPVVGLPASAGPEGVFVISSVADEILPLSIVFPLFIQISHHRILVTRRFLDRDVIPAVTRPWTDTRNPGFTAVSSRIFWRADGRNAGVSRGLRRRRILAPAICADFRSAMTRTADGLRAGVSRGLRKREILAPAIRVDFRSAMTRTAARCLPLIGVVTG